MRRLALTAAPLAVLLLALAGGVASRADTPTPTPEPSQSPSASPSPSPEPLLPPPPPVDPKAAGPQPPALNPAYPGSLRPGDWVQITGTDSCLNMRYEPRLPVPAPDGTVQDNVLNCLPDGFVARLEGGVWGEKVSQPIFADERWWWHLTGQGWAAEEFLSFHHEGGIPWPERPDLAGAGLIAYLATDSSIWLMNADGSEQRPIVGSPGQSAYVQSLRWSPRGDRLAYTLTRWDTGSSVTATRVVDFTGAVIAEYNGLAEALWSPGGGRLSAIRVDREGDMGGYNGTPVVLDLDSGVEIAVGPLVFGMTAPAWSPDGSSVAYVCISNYLYQPDGSYAIDPAHSCDGDGLHIAAADGSGSRVVLPMGLNTGQYFSNPSWSPSGTTIALWSQSSPDGSGCRGYRLVDVATGATGACAPLPPVAGFIGGRCGGGPEMGASSWTADGSLVFSAQGAGQSGVFVYDVASGTQTVIPSMMAGPASLAPDGQHLTFSSGHIWVAGLDGANLTLLAEGHSPAWQPLP